MTVRRRRHPPARARGARHDRPARSAAPNARGVARLPLRRRTSLVTTSRAPGYIDDVRAAAFQQPPRGRGPAVPPVAAVADVRRRRRAHAGAVGDPRAAAVPGRLVARHRLADRVPGRRLRRGRVHRQLQGHRLRALDGRRARRLAARRARREDGRPRPRSSATSSSCTGWTAVVRVLDRRNGTAALAATRSARRSSRRRSSATASTTSARGTASSTRSTSRTRRVRWTLPRPAARSPRAPRSSGGTLFIGDYCGRAARARARAPGALRWSRHVNGRVYGTPAVAGGPRLRAALDGRLADRVLDRAAATLWRAAPAATSTRRRRSGAAASSSARYNGMLYGVSARDGRVLWTVAAGGPSRGAAAVVGGVAYAGFAHRIVGADARTGRVVLRFPHGAVRPGLGRGGGCSCTATRGSTRSQTACDEARCSCVAGAPVILARARRGAAFVLHRKHAGAATSAAPRRSSSCRQEVAADAARRSRGIVWPTYGHDAERLRVATGIALAPPFRRVWTFRAQNLSSSRPRSRTAGSTSRTTPARLFAISARTGSARGSTARIVARPPRRRSTTAPSSQPFLNKPPCNATAIGRRRARSRSHAGSGRVRGARRSARRSRRPSSSTDTVYVGDWRGSVYAFDARTGKLRWTFKAGGRVKGAVAVSGSRALLRLLRPQRLRAERADGEADLARRSAQQRLGHRGTFYANARGRLRPRLHRLDRRQGVLLRRHDRASSAGRSRPAATCTPRRRCGAAASRRLLRRALLLLRRRDRRHPLAVQGGRADLGLADRDRGSSSTSRR